jgi:hypothetical protein
LAEAIASGLPEKLLSFRLLNPFCPVEVFQGLNKSIRHTDELIGNFTHDRQVGGFRAFEKWPV